VDAQWKRHVVRAGPYHWSGDQAPTETAEHAKRIEPWLSALLQAEHVSLLLGSGFTLAVACEAGVAGLDMSPYSLNTEMSDAVARASEESARRCLRGKANTEDQIRAILALIDGLRVLAQGVSPGNKGIRMAATAKRLLKEWEATLEYILGDFAKRVLDTEKGIRAAIESGSPSGLRAHGLLKSFLLTFASRAASRDRLNLFTTNYDRLIEYGCDALGLRILDRFVGQVDPVFRSMRLSVDMHYNPPGMKGEPRYLEGVVRLSKLHGSVDWYRSKGPSGEPCIRRSGIGFGSAVPIADRQPAANVIIYPNPAKDVETLEYPYSELFRDFAAATCQPNSVVFTYGYGFGDEHINRILEDMLTISSTHLCIMSFSDADGRIPRFCQRVNRDQQITLLIGDHFGDMATLVANYLPKPAIDKTTLKMVELLNRRLVHATPDPTPEVERVCTENLDESGAVECTQ